MVNECLHSGDEFALFRKEMKGVKRISQDTLTKKKKSNKKQRALDRESREETDHTFYFSDQWSPSIDIGGYTSPDVPSCEIKRMHNGLYVPDIFLDMHGMRQREAKRELGAMIAYCLRILKILFCTIYHHIFGGQLYSFTLFPPATGTNDSVVMDMICVSG